MAIGSSGLRPGQSAPRIDMWPSFNGTSLEMSAKRLALASAGFCSTLEMRRFREATVWGGATESARIRPRHGSFSSKAALDGISEL